jgi:hypothetical protein
MVFRVVAEPAFICKSDLSDHAQHPKLNRPTTSNSCLLGPRRLLDRA